MVENISKHFIEAFFMLIGGIAVTTITAAATLCYYEKDYWPFVLYAPVMCVFVCVSLGVCASKKED